MSVGIDDIQIATGHHVLDLSLLAEARGIDPAKLSIGLGQLGMSLLAPDEDIVTMAAAAAAPIVERVDASRIRTVLVATESGVDQSKAAGVFVHRLLDLPSTTRVVELKQACYGGIAGVQLAADQVARRPDDLALVIATDVARYDLASPGEPTQGAGAVAMLVSADPRLVELDAVSGLHTFDVDDFWRPNDRTTALVDGHLSTSAYLDSLEGAWRDLDARGGRSLAETAHLLYHQPFTKMARKAHARLADLLGGEIAALDEAALDVGARLGNAYSASLPGALAGLLESGDRSGESVGMFSYGSGSVGEWMTGVVAAGAGQHDAGVRRAIDGRVAIDVPEYERLHAEHSGSSEDRELPRVTTGPFRMSGVQGGARRYERV